MTTTTAPIGIFDSGIGGLSILKALCAELPNEHFIYIADSGHAPYGERDDTHVIARSLAIAAYLVQQNVKALVVACNTATAAAIDLLRATYPNLPIMGVEPALKPAVVISQTKHIAVMATRSTLASAKFFALLNTQAGEARFTLLPCDDSENTSQPFDTLVLGCTHYPFAAKHIAALVGPGVQLLDTGEAVARQARRLLGRASPTHQTEQIAFISTGHLDALRAAASAWLDLKADVQTLLI